MKLCGERKRGSCWQRVVEILLLCGRILDLDRDDIYTTLSEGNHNNNSYSLITLLLLLCAVALTPNK